MVSLCQEHALRLLEQQTQVRAAHTWSSLTVERLHPSSSTSPLCPFLFIFKKRGEGGDGGGSGEGQPAACLAYNDGPKDAGLEPVPMAGWAELAAAIGAAQESFRAAFDALKSSSNRATEALKVGPTHTLIEVDVVSLGFGPTPPCRVGTP